MCSLHTICQNYLVFLFILNTLVVTSSPIQRSVPLDIYFQKKVQFLFYLLQFVLHCFDTPTAQHVTYTGWIRKTSLPAVTDEIILPFLSFILSCHVVPAVHHMVADFLSWNHDSIYLQCPAGFYRPLYVCPVCSRFSDLFLKLLLCKAEQGCSFLNVHLLGR